MMKFALGNRQKEEKDTRPWYDTYEGVLRSLQSLEGLNRLVRERQIAGYQRNERLSEFYILGRYHLDTCGNCCKVTGENDPKEKLPNIPDVLTHEEFFAHIKMQPNENDHWISFAMNGGNLPLPELTCAHCGKTWDIKNCHDVTVRHDSELIPLEDFVGQTLGDVKKFYHQKNDAIYRVQPDVIIRNDKNIDLSPKYPNPEMDWQKGCAKNENGWLRDSDGITDEYIIQAGDEVLMNIWKYYHQARSRENLKDGTERKFREVFEKAGFKTIITTAIPNGYYRGETSSPWFLIQTEVGLIKIGWRKRVINIDWSAIPDRKILPLFKKEDVTKEDTLIHAWSYEKAVEYLGMIRDHLKSQN